MPWVKLDDQFLVNPKVMRAGLQGRALYVAGLCYCAGGLTDGFIPTDVLPKLGILADVKKPGAAVAKLTEAGLWESRAGGYVVHDYLKYQPSAEEVRKERERVAAWRTEHVPKRVRNAFGTASHARDLPARTRPVPQDGLGNDFDAPARARAPDEPAARRAPSVAQSQDGPLSLRPTQTQCPLCPEIFSDIAELRVHLDTSPRHKVRPTADDLRRKPASNNAAIPTPSSSEIEAELDAFQWSRPAFDPAQLPPDLLAEHERLLQIERARSETA